MQKDFLWAIRSPPIFPSWNNRGRKSKPDFVDTRRERRAPDCGYHTCVLVGPSITCSFAGIALRAYMRTCFCRALSLETGYILSHGYKPLTV